MLIKINGFGRKELRLGLALEMKFDMVFRILEGNLCKGVMLIFSKHKRMFELMTSINIDYTIKANLVFISNLVSKPRDYYLTPTTFVQVLNCMIICIGANRHISCDNGL